MGGSLFVRSFDVRSIRPFQKFLAVSNVKNFYPFQFFTVKKILSETEFSFINFMFIKSATTKEINKSRSLFSMIYNIS
jgi:hypothetical protein